MIFTSPWIEANRVKISYNLLGLDQYCTKRKFQARQYVTLFAHFIFQSNEFGVFDSALSHISFPRPISVQGGCL